MQGTVVRAKHTFDSGLVPDKIVDSRLAWTMLWSYGMELEALTMRFLRTYL
jgi:hypothetical protein